MSDNEIISYAADVIVINPSDEILLIQRDWDPFKGMWALPGGHVDKGETGAEAAARELYEEAGLTASPEELTLMQIADAPNRDPRGRYVSAVYLLEVVTGTRVHAGDDAADAAWWPLDELPPLAFDHHDIIRRANVMDVDMDVE